MPTIDQPSEPASAFAVRLAWSEMPCGASPAKSVTALVSGATPRLTWYGGQGLASSFSAMQ